MRRTSLFRGTRATMVALLTLAALLGTAACGKDGGGLTDPPDIPIDPLPGDDDDTTPSGPEPVGDRIWAVDLDNNLLLFGAADPTVLSMKRRITGLPILNRVIGITFRRSDGRLYAVGNDSRVYTIDTLTAEATAVSQQRFSPSIVEFFDIHFAMVLEPGGDRVRLIAAESGGNWSISLDDGTATTGEKAVFAAGTEYEGQTPRLMGLVFAAPPPAGGASLRASMSVGPLDDCTELLYAIDADRAEMIGSCDPDSGSYEPLGKLPQENYARCGELMAGPGGLPDGTDVPPPGGLWVLAMRGAQYLNSLGTVNDDGSITWHGEVPSESPIQSAVFAEGGLYGPRPRYTRAPVSMASARAPQADAAPASDPRLQCPGA